MKKICSKGAFCLISLIFLGMLIGPMVGAESYETNTIVDTPDTMTIEDTVNPLSKIINKDSIVEELDLNQVENLYEYGIEKGIIDSKKYPFSLFEKHEKDIFRNMYQLFKNDVDMNEIPISYKDWLVMNNYGVEPDTKESIYDFPEKNLKTTAENKKKFCDTVKKGDILICTANSIADLIGHSAIMTTDNYVLEMPGGKSSNNLKDNNRQILKADWFDIHKRDWTTVYRCKNKAMAKKAASWDDRHYYNAKGGSKKTIHVDYKITTSFRSTNPSYCSKLVIHGYWFGSGDEPVLTNIPNYTIIPPLKIPQYFTSSKYALSSKGRF